VGFTLTQPNDHSALIDLDMHWTHQPKAVLLHLPWFADVSSVQADGTRAAISGGSVRIPPGAHQVRIAWSRSAGAPAWSFENAVQTYEQQYRQHYEIYMHGPQH
jgi:hypothetical protein